MKAYFPAHTALICMLLLMAAASCKKEGAPQVQYPIPSGLQLISSGYAPGVATRVEIYAANSLFVGYNNLYIALYDSVSNKRITQAQISLSAIIKTSAGTSQAPVENPSSINATNGLFNAAAVFVTPTASASNWTLTANIQNTGTGGSGGFTSTVNVIQPSPAKAYAITTLDDGTNLFVALVQPLVNPQIGTDTFEVSLYKQTSLLNFVPDSSYTMSINPVMPTMTGMTSPNNVNPVHIGNGRYLGKVVFTMYGGWQININLMHNSAVADTAHYFDINLST